MEPQLLLQVFLLALVAATTAFDIHDCGSVSGSFSKISISECDPPTGPFCSIKRGTNATLTVSFTTKKEEASVTAVVHGILGGIPIPFNLPNPDGCKESGISCPLKPGQEYVYLATLPVLQIYPKVRVTVKWELQSEDKKDIICFQLPAKII